MKLEGEAAVGCRGVGGHDSDQGSETPPRESHKIAHGEIAFLACTSERYRRILSTTKREDQASFAHEQGPIVVLSAGCANSLNRCSPCLTSTSTWRMP